MTDQEQIKWQRQCILEDWFDKEDQKAKERAAREEVLSREKDSSK